MTDLTFATFDENGRCVSIMRSMVPLDLPHPVPFGTKPENIYLDASGEVSLRSEITLAIDRDYYAADGIDAPTITGLPDDASLIVNGVINAELTSETPASVMVETIGKYKSNTLCIMFDDLSALAEKFAASVDKSAGEARLQFVTDAPGQSTVYAKKETEARAYLVNTSLVGPMLLAEAGGDLAKVEAIALRIVERADACNTALAEIEALRMTAKQAIFAATDVPSILAAVDIVWPNS